MKLYGNPLDCSTRKVLMTLAEKGARASLMAMAPSDLEVPASPRLELPLLDHDGFVLSGATTVMRYLDGALPGRVLCPPGLKARARMEQWLAAESAQLAPALRTLTGQLREAPRYGMEPDAALIAEARQEIGAALDLLERALGEGPYLVGALLSLADIAYFATLQALLELEQQALLQSRLRVSAYRARLRERSTFQAALAPRADCTSFRPYIAVGRRPCRLSVGPLERC